MNNIIDISVNNSKMKNVYPNTYGFTKNNLYTIDKNDVNSSYIHQDLHFGTHIDAPSHWIKNGKNIPDIDIDLFSGVCYVQTIKSVDNSISKDVLSSQLINKCDRIFFRANAHLNLYDKFNKDFTGMVQSGIDYLMDEIDLKVIGIDYLSIEKFTSDGYVHKKLLDKEVLIYETLYLKGVEDGFYKYYGYPILIDAEAAPVRIVIEKI